MAKCCVRNSLDRGRYSYSREAGEVSTVQTYARSQGTVQGMAEAMAEATAAGIKKWGAHSHRSWGLCGKVIHSLTSTRFLGEIFHTLLLVATSNRESKSMSSSPVRGCEAARSKLSSPGSLDHSELQVSNYIFRSPCQ